MLNLNGKTMREVIAIGEALKSALGMIGEAAVSETELASEAASIAYDLIEVYPEWTPDGHFTAGRIWNRNGQLYYCRQDHDGLNDPNRAPEVYTAGWKPIPNPLEDGSLKNPYSYIQGMELKLTFYYRQYGVTYRCIRPTPWLYEDLANVVGDYVEVVT